MNQILHYRQLPKVVKEFSAQRLHISLFVKILKKRNLFDKTGNSVSTLLDKLLYMVKSSFLQQYAEDYYKHINTSLKGTAAQV
jgi:hypothetical protein